MKTGITMKVIAHIENGFSEKFGIPRQSGLVKTVPSVIVFEPEYRNPDALRGLEEYSHLWLLWEFSESRRETWSPTVRPPRLGGNTRMGVFATRSPFRPNAVGLSSVCLERIEWQSDRGPLLIVTGADLLTGTPIYDIKPYLPFTDSHPDAVGGFADTKKDYALKVEIPETLLQKLPKEMWDAVHGILSQDPRPSYQQDPERIYGVKYNGYNVQFRVEANRLTVCGIQQECEE